jgi:hypothetical protein
MNRLFNSIMLHAIRTQCWGVGSFPVYIWHLCLHRSHRCMCSTLTSRGDDSGAINSEFFPNVFSLASDGFYPFGNIYKRSRAPCLTPRSGDMGATANPRRRRALPCPSPHLRRREATGKKLVVPKDGRGGASPSGLLASRPGVEDARGNLGAPLA